MIKHIVLMALPDNYETKERKDIAVRIKAALEDLPKKIKEIKYYEIGLNIKSSDSINYHDLVLVSIFDNSESLNHYVKHPEHVQVVNFIKSFGCQFTSVDFNVES